MMLDCACENRMPSGSSLLLVGAEVLTHEIPSLVELTRAVGASLHAPKKLGHNQCVTSFQGSGAKRT